MSRCGTVILQSKERLTDRMLDHQRESYGHNYKAKHFERLRLCVACLWGENVFGKFHIINMEQKCTTCLCLNQWGEEEILWQTILPAKFINRLYRNTQAINFVTQLRVCFDKSKLSISALTKENSVVKLQDLFFYLKLLPSSKGQSPHQKYIQTLVSFKPPCVSCFCIVRKFSF